MFHKKGGHPPRGPRIIAVVLVLFTACAPAAAPAGTPRSAVEIRSFSFKPADLEVPVGATVTWANGDDVLHTVTTGETKNTGIGTYDATPDGRMDGRMDGSGKTFSFAFASAGTYRYYCDRHRHMTGTVVVR